MRVYTYIAADFDHDENAVNHLHWMRDSGWIGFFDAHMLQQSNDHSLACSIKKSLKYRLNNSYRFVLVVGPYTDYVSKGGCQLCSSYNSYVKYCVKGYSIDYRSFIKYECDKAVEAELKIVVLYNSITIDRSLCPEAVRWKGVHQKMINYGADGRYYWDNISIAQALRE